MRLASAPTTAWMAIVLLLPLPLAAGELADAARTGDRTRVIQLLAGGADANDAHVDGTAALHWAARLDDLDMAAALLDGGADPAARNRYGVTPLNLAATNGSAAMIRLLLDAGARPNEVGIEGETVLMTASRTGNADAAAALLESGADVASRESWRGQTALMWAAAEGHPDVVRLLIDHGADVNARSAIRDWERQTTAEPRAKWMPLGGLAPLTFAAREGCVGCVEILVSAGADIHGADSDGVTPMLTAIINGHYDVAATLLDLGADPNLADATGQSPLYAAVHFNTMPESNRPAPEVIRNEISSFRLMELLMAAGADVNRPLDRQVPYRTKLDRGNDTMLNTGTTPLLRAAKSADVRAIRFLLDHGADPALTTRNGANPLMAAAGLGTRDSDSTGRYKTAEQMTEAIGLFLDAGLDINAADSRGRTAAHGAALQGFDEVIRYLAAHGADVGAADNDGVTPLDMALGLAGGFGFSGADSVVRESTAAVIRELTAPAPQ